MRKVKSLHLHVTNRCPRLLVLPQLSVYINAMQHSRIRLFSPQYGFQNAIYEKLIQIAACYYYGHTDAEKAFAKK